jgi:hypothetical protein
MFDLRFYKKEGSKKTSKNYNVSHHQNQALLGGALKSFERGKILEVRFLGALGVLVANSLFLGYRSVDL